MKISCLMTSVAKIHFPVFWLIVLFLSACSGDAEPTRFHGSTMGTSYNVTLPFLPEELSKEEIQREFDALLAELNREMSTYQADSVISGFNRSESTDWYPVSASFVRVSQTALELSRLTEGAYDVTVAPLIELWGFGNKDTVEDSAPDQKSIELALEQTGYHKLFLQTDPHAIRKSVASISIDFSSIAKGYGVDVLSNYLDSLGISDYLVEIGGELRASGKNGRGEWWQIAVESPNSGERSIQRIIGLKDVSVATSGDYRNYFEQDGKRYSHIIDAATGRPVNHDLASVSVLADTSMLADGWATALMLLGEKKGYDLAEKEGLAAYFIYRKEGGFLTQETAEFSRLVGEEDSMVKQ